MSLQVWRVWSILTTDQLRLDRPAAESQSRLGKSRGRRLEAPGSPGEESTISGVVSLPELRLASPWPSLSLDRTWRADMIRVLFFERSRDMELARSICV